MCLYLSPVYQWQTLILKEKVQLVYPRELEI